MRFVLRPAIATACFCFPSLAVVHAHCDSVLALRIVFSLCLVIVLACGVYIFRIRKRLFDRDPEVVADHWARATCASGR